MTDDLEPQCYIDGCAGEPIYTFSWRIRGPVEEGGPHDRIPPGYTNSGIKACTNHVPALADVCVALFRS